MLAYRAPYPLLEGRFLREVRRLRERDRLARVLLMVPRPLLGRALLRGLAQAGEAGFGLVPMTVDEVAYRLAASGLGSRNLRPLPPAAARVLVADLLDALPRDHVFDPCRALPGVPARLWQTLETLRLHDLSASSWKAASTDGGFAPQVRARLHALGEMLQKVAMGLEVEHGADRSDTLRLAADVAPQAGWLGDFQALVLYGAFHLAPLELRLLQALADRVPVAGVFAPSDLEASPGARPFLHWVSGLPDTASPSPGRGEDQVPASLRLLSIPGPGREGRELARELVRLAERGLRWHEMAVLSAGGDSEAGRLAQDLASFGIPCYAAAGEPLAARRPGRLLACLLEVFEHDFPRLRTIELLQLLGEHAAPDVAGGVPLPDLPVLEVASARAMIRGGGEAWQRMAERQASRLWGRRGETAPAQEGEALRRGAAWVAALVELRGTLPRDGTPGDMARALARILRALMRDSAERKALETVVLEITAWRSGARLGRSAFRRLIEERLAEERVQEARFGQGTVFVGSLDSAEGLVFRALCIQGLDGAAFPPALSEDPLLLDDEKESLDRLLEMPTALPRASWQPLRQAGLLASVVASAREHLVLSWSRINEKGQPQNPSPLLLDFVGLRTGQVTTAHDLEILCAPGQEKDLGLLSVRSPSLSHLVPDALESLLDGQELGMRMASADRGCHRLAAASDWARRLQEASLAALEPRLTGYDGLISGAAAVRALHEWLDRQQCWSVTAFERYASCPRSFLLDQVLGLRPVAEPEGAEGLDGSDFGSLIHRVLEGCFRRVLERGQARFTWPPSPEVRVALDEAWDEATREVRAAGRAGDRLHWERASRDARDRLMALLEWQAGQDDWTPRQFEMDTEIFETVVAVDPVPTTLRMRGRIDRLDMAAGGRSARIIDYKTASRVQRPPGQGTALQLPLYARAVESRLGGRIRVEQALYVCLTSERRVRSVILERTELEQAAQAVDGFVARIWEGMQAGLFFPHPRGGTTCRTCSFTSWCGRSVDLVARRKQADLRLQPFLAMGEADSAPSPAERGDEGQGE